MATISTVSRNKLLKNLKYELGYPIRKFERLPGGWGIVMDDVMAGVYSCITLHILGRWVFWT